MLFHDGMNELSFMSQGLTGQTISQILSRFSTLSPGSFLKVCWVGLLLDLRLGLGHLSQGHRLYWETTDIGFWTQNLLIKQPSHKTHMLHDTVRYDHDSLWYDDVTGWYIPQIPPAYWFSWPVWTCAWLGDENTLNKWTNHRALGFSPDDGSVLSF